MKALLVVIICLIYSTAIAQNPSYSGGTSDGYSSSAILGAYPFNMYSGGPADGNANQTMFTSLAFNMFKGGSDDGFAYYNGIAPTPLEFYRGGINDGFAFHVLTTASTFALYKGGNSDGFAYNKILPVTTFAMYKGGNADGFAWDDNAVAPTVCNSPTNLGQLAFNPTSITLGWTPGQSNSTYEIMLVRTSLADTFLYTGAITSSPMNETINCLPQFTFFTYYIRESCGGNTYSPWVNGNTAYTTPGGCQQPTAQASSTTSATSAGLSWISNYAPSSPKPYQISYGTGITNAAQGIATAITTPQPSQVNNSTISHQLTLAGGVANVTWFVREVCAQCDTTLWTGPHTVSAYNPGGGGNCVTPTNQALIYPGTTNFGVRWTSPYFQQQGYSYQVVGGYGIASPSQATVFSSGTYTSMQFSYPSAIVFASSTNFTWWVRNICGPGDTTAWAGPHTIGSNKTDETIGIEEIFKSENWIIYPNPNHGQVLYVNIGDADAKEIRVNDVTGKLIMHKQTGGEQLLQLDVSSLASGMYIVQLVTSNSVLTKPLSINK